MPAALAIGAFWIVVLSCALIGAFMIGLYLAGSSLRRDEARDQRNP